MDFQSKNLTVPRGKVFFAPFLPGTTKPGAMKDFGNCPTFTLSADDQSLSHYSSQRGIRTLDGTLGLSSDFTGTLTTDDYRVDNLRYWFMSEGKKVSVTGESQSQTVTAEKGGMYKLGVTETNMSGVRNILTLEVSDGTTTYEEFVDYDLHYETGYVTFLEAGAIADGDEIELTFTSEPYTFTEMKTGRTAIQGEMRFVSFNGTGPNRELVIPRVEIKPNGDMSFIGDAESPDWGEISFTLTSMVKGNLPSIINAEGLPAYESVTV